MSPSDSSRVAYRHVRVHSEDRLRVLTLARPPLNVLNIATLAELAAAAGAVGQDGDAAALLITGEGRAFSAGVDVADHTEDRVDEMMKTLHRALTSIMKLEIPVVAAVNGAALGGGLEVALACDIIVARAGAKLGQPEIQLGVFPPFAAAVLPRRVGRATALDICLTGRTFTAEEGLELGLVQHVYEAHDFDLLAMEYACGLASLSPPVLRLTKRAVDAQPQGSVADALLTAEDLYLDDLMRLADAREGLAAFLEKRPPAWKGA